MRKPIHTIQVETDSELEIEKLLRDAYLNIPSEIEQQNTEEDLFAIRLYIMEYVVGLLPEVRSESAPPRWKSPRYEIKIELGIKYFSICFNGHRKIFNW
ncbi:hypothetical protein [Gimesia aquarii]|uniref:Uncharacterized protein n=1 Tax=Gimesia aquarii TaxID=2527964 RepID=A0A517VSW1_9PLAN|nr:hypothetical protein [Gimesia aquarii]QDT96103.1 hypothetical protein V144x_15560 [Gimesia aquarii]